MTDKPAPERLSLSRWSRRKLAASTAPANAPAASVGAAPVGISTWKNVAGIPISCQMVAK
jgi:hypothetical protein